jgi:hypothetical protein
MSGTAVLATSGGDDQLDILDRSTLSSFHHLESVLLFPESSPLLDMPRTAAQRAARLRRKKAQKSHAPKRGGQPSRPPTRRAPKPGNRRPLLRNPQRISANPFGPGTMRPPRVGAFMNANASRNTSTNRRRQVVEEDEYIADITSSVNFTVTPFAVNPGQSSVFPWGSKVAALYDEYEFEYLEFYYKREVTEYNTNANGKVILSFVYDATQALPLSKQQVEDSVPHVDDVPSCPKPLRLSIDCGRIRKNDSKYVRPGAQPANTDLKTYDAGQLFVSTIGQASAAFVGELHVRYKVHFTEPILDQPSVAGSVAHWSSIAATSANNLAAAVLQSGNTLAGIVLGTNTVTFPAGQPGNYFVLLTLAGGTSAATVAATVSAGATVLTLLTQSAVRDSISEVFANGGTTTNPTFNLQCVTVANSGGLITYTPGTVVGTGSMDLFIFALPNSILSVDEKEQLEIDELRERADLQDAKIDRLMALLSGSASPTADFEERKESDMDTSIHIPRSLFAKLLPKA